MCSKVIEAGPWQLKDVTDWFVTKQQIQLWHDDDDYCNNDKLIEWHDGYKKRKAQKAQIKEQLMPIAWHLSRYCDWCDSEEKKQGAEKFWR